MITHVWLRPQEEDVWMRVELHDASLVPAHLRPPSTTAAKQPLGDSLRKALRSLSSSSGASPSLAPNSGPHASTAKSCLLSVSCSPAQHRCGRLNAVAHVSSLHPTVSIAEQPLRLTAVVHGVFYTES